MDKIGVSWVPIDGFPGAWSAQKIWSKSIPVKKNAARCRTKRGYILLHRHVFLFCFCRRIILNSLFICTHLPLLQNNEEARKKETSYQNKILIKLCRILKNWWEFEDFWNSLICSKFPMKMMKIPKIPPIFERVPLYTSPSLFSPSLFKRIARSAERGWKFKSCIKSPKF